MCAAANWLCVGRLTVQRLQEFAQDHEDKVMMYITPNGDKVMHAYTRNNVVLLISIMAMCVANCPKKEAK